MPGRGVVARGEDRDHVADVEDDRTRRRVDLHPAIDDPDLETTLLGDDAGPGVDVRVAHVHRLSDDSLRTERGVVEVAEDGVALGAVLREPRLGHVEEGADGRRDPLPERVVLLVHDVHRLGEVPLGDDDVARVGREVRVAFRQFPAVVPEFHPVRRRPVGVRGVLERHGGVAPLVPGFDALVAELHLRREAEEGLALLVRELRDFGVDPGVLDDDEAARVPALVEPGQEAGAAHASRLIVVE